ncbi:thioredoxin reductase (NADPH) [Neolewinella xylanilytica]|uniref:Ferredoxin--NADP reductase n=1 Tax=Neolewinella xylanilytica TaxID=1514080 RepID=A0A2S6I2Z7_9BACT|nr:NAD(P)/FAD-dependent oxidoreductase [Neolewinella xylanilytica]PPK85547.1 thioredoxin reductase (NADPH) [Neolewinella xylanilytica]
MNRTDILIIGAGPVGLFTVFEAGLLKMRCHLVDSLGQPGGQLTEIYPKKPIYDIPGYPSVLAGELIENLMEQIAPFNPEFTLGERAEKLEKVGEKMYRLTTSRGTVIEAPVICIAGGLGCFEPRKPPIPNIEKYEDNGVAYVIRDPEVYRDRKVLLAGGGDSALDWTIFLADVAKEVTLVHRRDSFRGALDSVEKVHALAESGRVNLITNAQAVGIVGDEGVQGVTVKLKSGEQEVIEVDDFIPLFGLSPKLGPIADWNLTIDKNAIEVDTRDYSTGVPGIYAIGDINTYPGKLKLILCGFHEGTMAVQSAFSYIYPDKKLSFKYTTVNGVEGLPKEEEASVTA